jgi:signal transduction histidine kinase
MAHPTPSTRTRSPRTSNSWSLLFDQLPHPACTVHRGRIADANRAMQFLLKESALELTGRSLSDALPTTANEKLFDRMKRSAEGTLSCTLSAYGQPMLYNCKWVALAGLDDAYLLTFEPGMSVMPTALEKDLYDDLRDQRNLIELMIETDEMERKKFSDYLHDEIGSLLATTKHQLDILTASLHHDIAQSKTELDKSVVLVDESIRQLRRIAMQTAPVSIEFGLPRAVRFLIDVLNKKAGIGIQLILLPEDLQLPRSLEIVVYRIVQELLTNCISHSGATEIILQIVLHTSSVTIVTEDNGKGFDFKKEKRKKGTVGLKKIMQRVELFDGKMQIDSKPGQGSIVTIDLTMH